MCYNLSICVSPLSSRKVIKQTKRKLLHFKPLKKELVYVLIANRAILGRENLSRAEYHGRRNIYTGFLSTGKFW